MIWLLVVMSPFAVIGFVVVWAVIVVLAADLIERKYVL